MAEPWLDIIGIGEDGMAGLSADAAARVTNAEIIISGERHHHLAPDTKARRIAWPGLSNIPSTPPWITASVTGRRLTTLGVTSLM